MPCSGSATIEQIDEGSVELADDEIQIWSFRTPASGMLSGFSGATASASLSTATGRKPPAAAGWGTAARGLKKSSAASRSLRTWSRSAARTPPSSVIPYVRAEHQCRSWLAGRAQSLAGCRITHRQPPRDSRRSSHRAIEPLSHRAIEPSSHRAIERAGASPRCEEPTLTTKSTTAGITKSRLLALGPLSPATPPPRERGAISSLRLTEFWRRSRLHQLRHTSLSSAKTPSPPHRPGRGAFEGAEKRNVGVGARQRAS